MTNLDSLRRILEKYGAQRITRPDVLTSCDIYELDPSNHDATARDREIEAAGFEIANWYSTSALNNLVENPTVTSASSSDPNQTLTAMGEGQVVGYTSITARRDVEALIEEGVILFRPGLDFILDKERERRHVLERNAIILAHPRITNLYALLIEKDQTAYQPRTASN